jgi:hypothetical protein
MMIFLQKKLHTHKIKESQYFHTATIEQLIYNSESSLYLLISHLQVIIF